ncbi:MAG: TIGR04255 family protein, partial [Candidatus Eremiobacteraeota bacterium]|nr:TIGR04255 family protein [Candidatus Eremiobacteraeota bacterium]
YESWELFRNEAKRLFEICCEVLSIKEVTRVSVRFINRFDLPGNSINLSEYFTVFPYVSSKFHMN